MTGALRVTGISAGILILAGLSADTPTQSSLSAVERLDRDVQDMPGIAVLAQKQPPRGASDRGRIEAGVEPTRSRPTTDAQHSRDEGARKDAEDAAETLDHLNRGSDAGGPGRDDSGGWGGDRHEPTRPR